MSELSLDDKVIELAHKNADLSSQLHRAEAKAARTTAARIKIEDQLDDLRRSMVSMRRAQDERDAAETEQAMIISDLQSAKRELAEERDRLEQRNVDLMTAKRRLQADNERIVKQLAELQDKVGNALPFLQETDSGGAAQLAARSGGWGDVTVAASRIASMTEDDLQGVSVVLSGALDRVRGRMFALLSERARKAEEEAHAKSEQRLCVVCLQREKNTVLRPCGHACCCSECARREELARCPICRSEISWVLDIYL